MNHPDEPIPCPACGYDLSGLPETACPECGSAFTAETAARIRSARAAAWREVLDDLHAARWLWACVTGSVAVLAVAVWVFGDAQAGVATLLIGCLLGVTGLAASWGVRSWTLARMADAESFGVGPSRNLRGAVRAVMIPSVLVVIPCVLFATAAWALWFMERIW